MGEISEAIDLIKDGEKAFTSFKLRRISQFPKDMSLVDEKLLKAAFFDGFGDGMSTMLDKVTEVMEGTRDCGNPECTRHSSVRKTLHT